jgi:hypothetical protein
MLGMTEVLALLRTAHEKACDQFDVLIWVRRGMKLTGQEVVDLQALRQLRSGNKPGDGLTTFRGKPMDAQEMSKSQYHKVCLP